MEHFVKPYFVTSLEVFQCIPFTNFLSTKFKIYFFVKNKVREQIYRKNIFTRLLKNMEIVERRGHLGLFIRCQWTQWTPRGVRNYKIIITYFLYIQNIDFRWSKKALLRRANLKKKLNMEWALNMPIHFWKYWWIGVTSLVLVLKARWIKTLISL